MIATQQELNSFISGAPLARQTPEKTTFTPFGQHALRPAAITEHDIASSVMSAATVGWNGAIETVLKVLNAQNVPLDVLVSVGHLRRKVKIAPSGAKK